MNKLSMITSAGVKDTYSVLHAGYVPVAERRVFGTFRNPLKLIVSYAAQTRGNI